MEVVRVREVAGDGDSVLLLPSFVHSKVVTIPGYGGREDRNECYSQRVAESKGFTENWS